MKAVEPQRNTGERFVMTADPAILKRIRGCPFARGGRVLVRFRANGYSLFARRSGEPLAVPSRVVWKWPERIVSGVVRLAAVRRRGQAERPRRAFPRGSASRRPCAS